jgi:TetR/AcrR family transcriptional repressor of nem operon
MPKPSHRQKILTEGLRLVHRRGFACSSVRDIVEAAGVPNGSFTNHFASKEAFGLEVMDLYHAQVRDTMREVLLNDSLPPLKRLRTYLDTVRDFLTDFGLQNGCLYGNFTAEASEHSEAIRLRLVAMFSEIRQAYADCLKDAVKAGEVSPNLNCDEVASFIFASHQGAILMSKAQRSPDAIERFKKILFSSVLR